MSISVKQLINWLWQTLCCPSSLAVVGWIGTAEKLEWKSTAGGKKGPGEALNLAQIVSVCIVAANDDAADDEAMGRRASKKERKSHIAKENEEKIKLSKFICAIFIQIFTWSAISWKLEFPVVAADEAGWCCWFMPNCETVDPGALASSLDCKEKEMVWIWLKIDRKL